MAQEVKIVHVDDVPIERMQESDGWAISEFRLPISGRDGSETTIFHSIFRAGSTHARHVHHRCDEFTAYLRGHGVVGEDEARAEVGPGHRRLIPQGAEHFFHNENEEGEALVVGFYMGAVSVEDSGYEHRGNVEPGDVERPLSGIHKDTFVSLEETPVTDTSRLPGWSQAEVRTTVGRHVGSANAMIDVWVPPGAEIGPHRMEACEQLYYVMSGSGHVDNGGDDTEISDGHVIFVPRGAAIGVRNPASDPLWLLGVLTGAGGVPEAAPTAA